MSEPAAPTTVARPGSSVLGRAGRARLRIVYPASVEGDVWLGPTAVEIGRQPGPGGFTLDEATVSRRHARFEWDVPRGVHRGLDLGSRNGSAIDGVRVQSEPRALVTGSLVRLGDVLMIYEQGEGLDELDEGTVSRAALPGEAATVRALRARLGKAGADPAPALVIGASGAGKERLAGELHRLSGRAGRFVAVNCAALSAQLIESQLFGHLKGAFTGAIDAQPGLFRAAHGGTLFLDEIGELPLDLQPKLLRAIQEGEVQPVGSTQGVRVDVRVVAATNRDLASAVDAGQFRRDLYARLSMWELAVPALYQRRVDILTWIALLHRHWCEQRGVDRPAGLAFEVDAAEALLRFAWPTNLRGVERLIHELEAAGLGTRPIPIGALPAWIDRPAAAANTAPGAAVVIAPAAAPAGASASSASSSPSAVPTREEFLAAFSELKGSVHGLAKRFGRDRRQIYRWMEAHGLRDKGGRNEGGSG